MAGKSAARGSESEQEQPVAMAPPPAAAAPAAGADDLVEKLQQLTQLQDEGVLTPDEFAAAKAQLLAG
jgi:hypothetical protein